MSTNPLMSKMQLPGRVFALPSKGIFYDNTVLSDLALANNGEIEVKPLTGLMELKLKSADLLYTGRVLQEICNECIPDIKNATALSIVDTDALFIFLRMSTYGNLLEISSIHNCKDAKMHSYQINMEEIIASPHNESLTGSIDLLFSLTLPNNQVVHIKPLTFANWIKIVHMRQDLDIKMKDDMKDSASYTDLLETISILDILSIIKDVDGIIDQKQLSEWIKSIPSKYAYLIKSKYDEVMTFGFKLSKTLVCKDCATPFSHNLQLDPISFFSE